MKIYVQSNSGNYNVTLEAHENTLGDVLNWLRESGGYEVRCEPKPTKCVPFEEIEYIRFAIQEEWEESNG